MSWAEKYKKSIDCDNPKGFSQRAHCQGRKKKMTESKGENIRFSKFSHATKHFKKSQHQLDPNIDIKHLVHHSTVQYIDRDADGDVDIFDNPKKGIPDENVQSASKADSASKKLIAKQKGELKHTRIGVAYEKTDSDLEKMITEGKKKGLWDNIHAKRKRGERAARPGEKGYPKTLDIGEGLAQAKKNVGASKCWDGKKIGNPPTKIKGGKEVPNCVDESLDIRGKKEPVRYCPRCGKDETRSECRYGGNYWDMFSLPSSLTPNSLKFDIAQVHPTNEEKDHEHSMARAEISKIISAARRLRGKVKGEGNLPAWVQSKITRAADYIDTAADYADSGEMHEENIQEALPAIGMLLGRLLGGAAGSAVAPAVTARIAGPAAQGSLRALVGQKVGEIAGTATQQHIQKRIEDKFKKKEPVEQGVEEGISYEIGHTSADTRRALRQDKIIKRAQSGQQGADAAKKKITGIQLPLANSTDLKTFGQFMQEAIDKSSMKCNSPKAQAHGSGEQGKSHVVKACEGGKEKIIRFGQVGVKGSPKKEGESEADANRRNRFKARHAENIAKGKMFPAYWANKVKW